MCIRDSHIGWGKWVVLKVLVHNCNARLDVIPVAFWRQGVDFHRIEHLHIALLRLQQLYKRFAVQRPNCSKPPPGQFFYFLSQLSWERRGRLVGDLGSGGEAGERCIQPYCLHNLVLEVIPIDTEHTKLQRVIILFRVELECNCVHGRPCLSVEIHQVRVPSGLSLIHI